MDSKDLFAVKGYKTTWGSVPYKDQVIDEDAFVYTQLKKAGAVLCAKLTLGELAYADLWFGGRTRNPWNLQGGLQRFISRLRCRYCSRPAALCSLVQRPGVLLFRLRIPAEPRACAPVLDQ